MCTIILKGGLVVLLDLLTWEKRNHTCCTCFSQATCFSFDSWYVLSEDLLSQFFVFREITENQYARRDGIKLAMTLNMCANPRVLSSYYCSVIMGWTTPISVFGQSYSHTCKISLQPYFVMMTHTQTLKVKTIPATLSQLVKIQCIIAWNLIWYLTVSCLSLVLMKIQSGLLVDNVLKLQ